MGSLHTVVFTDADGNDVPIGYMRPRVLELLLGLPASLRGELEMLPSSRTVRILRDQHTEADRTKTVAALAARWRDEGAFRILRGWKGEMWPVYGQQGELLFSVERGAMGLFGCMRYGVHMVAYVSAPGSSHGIKIWVAKRAATKSSYPGMLDNTAAGGLTTGEDPFECLIREADEEASLPERVTRQHAKEVGTVSYIYITDERAGGEPGWIYPECQWLYDLLLPADVIPTPKDGEVERFDLCTVEEVKEHLARGRFKPNCALVTLDFFIRHGILTRENEPDYDEIVSGLRRVMPFPGPHQKYEQAAGP